MRFTFALILALLAVTTARGSAPPGYESPVAAEGKLRETLAALSSDDFSPAAEAVRTDYAKLLIFAVERDFTTATTLLEPLLERAKLRADSAAIESLQNTLGVAYGYMGRDAEARALLDASCDAATARLGPEHPDTLSFRGNRASFLAGIGEAAQAEAELRDIAMICHRRNPDSDDALHARTQWSISLGRLGRWPEAERELRDIIARRTHLLGPEHPYLSHQLNLLCWVLYSTDRSVEAIPVMEQLVAIRTRELGPDSPRTLTVRYNLAAVYARAGRYVDAETILHTDLAAIQARPDDSQHEAADYLFKLGELALYRDDPATAISELAHAESLYQQPKPQGRRDSEQRDLEKTRLLLARAQIAGGNIAAARHTTAAWLTQLEGQFNLHLAYTSEADRLAFLANERPFDLPGTLGDADLLARASLRLKGLVLDSLLEDQLRARASADPATQEILRAYQTALAAPIQDEADSVALPVEDSPIEQLERELTRRAVPIAIQRTALSVNPADLLANLPDDTAFVDYLRYRHDLSQLAQEERYLALVGSRAGWHIVPLGPATIIDDYINRYHILVQRGGPIAWAQTVRRLILDPVRATLPKAINQLFVSADSALQSVAFASLPEDDVTHVAANSHRFAYVTSGRDLLVRPPIPGTGNPLVLAAPLWSGELAALPPLPESAAEGTAVAARFPGAILLTGADANITALRAHGSPPILHIATHTVSDPTPDLPLATRLRRTGLALAGDPGVLDALQISTLDLRGTDLVFLSGCETGGGEIANGEGVLGLQRGFVRAGARALVLTLWPVADQDSRLITGYFYDELAQSHDPVNALSRAQQKFREELILLGIAPAEVLRRAGAHTISVRR